MLKEIKNESRIILKHYLNNHYLKKKQYAIKYLKAAQKITEQKMKTKRIKKFQAMLNKSKVFNKTFTEGCVNLILIFHFKFKVDVMDNQIVEQYIKYQQDPKLDLTETSKLIFEEFKNWENLINNKNNQKMNLVVQSISDKIKKYNSLEQQELHQENQQDEFSSDEDIIEQEHNSSGDDNDDGIEMKAQEQINETINQDTSELKILQEGDEHSSDDDNDNNNIQIEFEEIKETSSKITEEEEHKNKSKYKHKDKDNNDVNDDDKNKQKIEKQKQKKRKINSLTPEFIFEIEKQTKWENKNQMKDTFFLLKEQADQIRQQIGTSKREYIITKKARREVRFENLDKSKLTKRRKDYTKNKSESGTTFRGNKSTHTRRNFKESRNSNNFTKYSQKSQNENHPSYQLRKDQRDIQSKGKFAGKIIDL